MFSTARSRPRPKFRPWPSSPDQSPDQGCELEDGIPIPRDQVQRWRRFNAANITCASMTLGSMMPCDVLATLSPNTGKATKLEECRPQHGVCARSTRVETSSQSSWRHRATVKEVEQAARLRFNPTRIGRPSVGSTARPCLYLFDYKLLISLATFVERSATFSDGRRFSAPR